METWYFETSAVNFLMEDQSVDDALATKQLQLNQGRDWRISPVTLWEILMTSDESRREQIVHFCQHLFARELLPSPTELIIGYIRQGMPQIEWFSGLNSNSCIAGVWRELVDDRSLALNIDHQDLKERIKLTQTHTKNIHQIIKHGDLLVFADDLFGDMDGYLSSLVNELPFIKSGEPTTTEQGLTYKVALYYIMMILCAEADFDNEPIKNFWREIGIESTQERIYYVIRELPTLLHKGPFVLMAIMTISQASGKYPRGVWHDSLHSIYITYVDKVFTTDGHFQGLRDEIPLRILRGKIFHMDEVEWTNHKIDQFGVPYT